MNTIKKSTLKSLGIPEELIKIYKKQKNYRTFRDNLLLIQRNDHLNCFQKILKTHREGELIYETIIKNLDFMIYEPGKVIYYPKDMITNVFYIFHGSVKVDKTQYEKFPSPIKKKSPPIKMKTNSKIKSPSSNIINFNFTFSGPIGEENIMERLLNKDDNNWIKEEMDENNENDNDEKKDVKELGFFKKLFRAVKQYKIYKENKLKSIEYNNDSDSDNEGIITLFKGDEYGVNDINLPRRLDLVETQTVCIIGFLSKHDFKFIFEKTDALKKNDIFSFLKALKLLQKVNNEVVINNIYNAINERRIYRGEYLIKRGEIADKFFIIRKGDFQVNLNIKQKIKNNFNDLNYFGHYTLKEKSTNIKYEIKNHYYNDEKYKIVTYGEGEIIGDIELYLNSNKYLTDIFCNTDSSLVYEINYKDFNINSHKTMQQLLLLEGEQKLKYFQERILDIKKINSKKMNNINRFKEIISNKLEEDKGEIFKQIENDTSDRYKYENRQRKRLKSAILNNNLNNIIKEINILRFENNLFSNYKFKVGKGRNRCIFKLKKENNDLPIFPTRISNNKSKFFTDETDLLNNKDSLSINFFQSINKINDNLIPKNNESTKSLFYKSPKRNEVNKNYKNQKLFNQKFTLGVKNLKSLMIKDNNYIKLRSKKLTHGLKLSPKKKNRPMTLNEKFQNIFTKLFINKKNRNALIEDYDSINNINYYNTQDSSTKKTTEYSKNSLNNFYQNILKSLICETNKDNKFFSPKIDERFYKNDNLLTEIINNRKKNLLTKLYSNKSNNYKYNEKKENKK